MDEKFRSRKLFIMVMIELIGTGLLIAGHIGEDVWKDITIMVGGAYLISQAWIDRSKS